jgi:mRNA-degrading endonuclease toxin of MazEF toxin-antitoxin module
MVGKPRYALVLAAQTDARLALASVVLITKQFEDTPYEVTLPRVPWLQDQSYINVQSIQPVKFTEFVRKAPGKFDARVIRDVEAALKRWLKL